MVSIGLQNLAFQTAPGRTRTLGVWRCYGETHTHCIQNLGSRTEFSLCWRHMCSAQAKFSLTHTENFLIFLAERQRTRALNAFELFLSLSRSLFNLPILLSGDHLVLILFNRYPHSLIRFDTHSTSLLIVLLTDPFESTPYTIDFTNSASLSLSLHSSSSPLQTN